MKSIFFDADGVLFASERPEDSINRILKRYGVDYSVVKDVIDKCFSQMCVPDEWIDTLEQENKMWHDMFEKIIERIDIDNKDKLLDDLATNAVYYKNSYLLDGVTEFLENNKSDYKYFVITNAYPSVYCVLDTLGLTKYFDGVFSSSDLHMCKPEEGIFKHALCVTECMANEAYFVDDSEANIITANRLGMIGILFNNRTNNLRNLKELLNC